MKSFIKKSIILITLFSFYMTPIYALDETNLERFKYGTGETTAIEDFGAEILQIIAIIASAISIIAIIILGIKYMMGSIEEKAEYKKTLLPYFIGACLVFGGSTIPIIINQMFK